MSINELKIFFVISMIVSYSLAVLFLYLRTPGLCLLLAFSIVISYIIHFFILLKEFPNRGIE